MWCGFQAASTLINRLAAPVTGDEWDKHRVWLHVRWMREQSKTRVRALPYGGSHVWEMLDAMGRAGLSVDSRNAPELVVWRDRLRSQCGNDWTRRRKVGVKVAEFLAKYGDRSWYLCTDGHAFAHIAGEPCTDPYYLNHKLMLAFAVSPVVTSLDP